MRFVFLQIINFCFNNLHKVKEYPLVRTMMKKNNKYRNNSNNNNNSFIYSLNYKFDSHSPAGKICGTALELIKKYNDLAKEAHGNNNYVEAEVFRQYAEHYRKIVTEINEKKNQRQAVERKENAEEVSAEVQVQECVSEENVTAPAEAVVEEALSAPKKEFTVIEISSAEKASAEEKASKPRGRRPKKAVAE